MVKTGRLVSFLLLLSLPLAAVAAPTKPAPRTLDTVESHAAAAVGHADNHQWSLVKQDAQATETAWRSLRPQLAREKVSNATLKGFDGRIAEFRRAADAKRPNQMDIEQRANAVTALVPDLQAYYLRPVPNQVARLNYLGRQIQIDNRAGQRVQAHLHAAQLSSTWNNVRSQATKVAASTSKVIDRDVAQIKASPVSKTAMTASRDLAGRLNELEKGFTVASARRTRGGGAGMAPPAPKKHLTPKKMAPKKMAPKPNKMAPTKKGY